MFFGHKERCAEGHPVPGTMQDSGDTAIKQVDMLSALYRVLSRCPGTVVLCPDLDIEDHGDILDVDSRVFSI